MRSRLRKSLLNLPGFEALCRRLTRGHVRVLMYHRFTDDRAAYPRRMPLDEFRRQLDHLAATCRVVDPDAQAAFERGDVLSGAPLAVITVDDGYADFRDHAVPVLREKGLPATLFVTSGFVEGTSWMWWDRVSHILEATVHAELDFEFGAERLQARLDTEAGRERFWSILVPALRFVPDPDKEEIIARLADQLEVAVPSVPPARYAALGWDDLRRLCAEGINCGGHTRTHPILAQVDRARAREEIAGGREDLAARLGTGTTWFAYPQGGPADYTAETVDCVREAGFSGSYVAYCDPRLINNPWAKVRYHVSTDLEQFRWIVCGADYLMLRLRAMLGKPTGVGGGYWQGADLAAGKRRA